MRRRLAAALVAVGVAVLAAGCMSGGNSSSSRQHRQAALVEERSSPDMSLSITGLTPSGKVISVDSYSWGVRGPANFEDLHIVKSVDETSPLLFSAATQNTRFTNAVLKLNVVRGGRPATYDTFTLEGVMVSNVENGGQASSQNPAIEQVSFSYETIQETVTIPDASGNPGPPVRFGWDLTRQRPL